jgi:hypothetical protein
MSDQIDAATAATEEALPVEDVAAETTQEAAAPDTVQDSGTDSAPKGDRPKESARERRERQRQSYLRQIEEANARADQAEQAAARIRQAATEKPKEADFESYDDFVAAKAVWTYANQSQQTQVQQAEQEAQEARRAAQTVQQQDRALVAQAFQEQITEARTRYTDYDHVVMRPGLFPPGNHLPDLIMGSEKAADLAYQVALDQRLHDRLISMHPIDAARELGRLEATMSTLAPRTETQAPPPISPVKGKAAATIDPSKMSYAEYRAARMAGKL